MGSVFYTNTRFQGQEEYSYARQQIDHPDGHKRTILVLKAHQAHQKQVLHDQGQDWKRRGYYSILSNR